jgi:predicted solute-binding protein
MTDAVMRQHIELYVNDYSKTLGPKGIEAILKMLEVFNVDVATRNEDYFFVG